MINPTVLNIEYCIGAGYQGHGYAGEALSAIIEYGLTQAGFTKLEAYHRTGNIRSGKVFAEIIHAYSRHD